MLSEPRILPSALTHGVTDQSIRHATRNVMRRVDFDDRLTLLIGPDMSAELLGVISLRKENRITDIEKFLDEVDPEDYTAVDTTAVSEVARLTDERAATEQRLTEAVLAARAEGHSWGLLAIALRVSRQAARQKYGPLEDR